LAEVTGSGIGRHFPLSDIGSASCAPLHYYGHHLDCHDHLTLDVGISSLIFLYFFLEHQSFTNLYPPSGQLRKQKRLDSHSFIPS
jgi:hypothetical protein